MRLKKIVLVVTGVLFVFTLNSCKKDKDPAYGSISIRLTDSPGIYQQVNLDI